MNKDEAREAAWEELRTVPLLLEMDEVMNTVCDPRHRNMQMVKLGFGKGFDAGAASVDRRAIVEKAFNMVKLIAGQRIEDDLVKQGKTTNRPYFHEAMDAVLAEMGGEE